MKSIVMLLFLVCVNSAMAQENFNDCPKQDEGSYLTQNNSGRSTYKGNGVEAVVDHLINEMKVDLSKPILDVGAGYGILSYELTKRGAKNLYINELNPKNLYCLKRNIDQSFPKKLYEPHYLLGDIADNKISNQVVSNSFGLIYAQNVIHFFTAQQIVDFLAFSARALENNGLLYVSFENPCIDQQKKLVDDIYIEYANAAKIHHYTLKEGREKLNQIVLNQYMQTPIVYGRTCSLEDYERTLNSIKGPGFPCGLETVVDGQLHYYQLLVPEILAGIVKHSGFRVLGITQSNNSITLMARKSVTA